MVYEVFFVWQVGDDAKARISETVPQKTTLPSPRSDERLNRHMHTFGADLNLILIMLMVVKSQDFKGLSWGFG